jgi:hypothetical protein
VGVGEDDLVAMAHAGKHGEEVGTDERGNAFEHGKRGASRKGREGRKGILWIVKGRVRKELDESGTQELRKSQNIVKSA